MQVFFRLDFHLYSKAKLVCKFGFFIFEALIMKKLLCFIFCLFPTWVLAYGGETPVSNGLQYVTDAMYGATGIAIATIAVMIVGLLCLGHMLKWSALAYTLIGISIIFGAGAIVSGITNLIHV